MDIPEKAREDIIKFQQIQQQLQVMMMQKQNVQTQKSEIDNALAELSKLEEKEAYEVIGNIMVKKSKTDIEKALKEKQELLDLRISTIEKQQDKITKSATELQEKLSKQIE